MSFNELSDNVNAVPSHSDGRQELEHIGTMASRVNTFPQLWVWALQIGECLGWNHRTSRVSNITQHLDKRPFVAFARFCWYFLLKTCFTERFLMCPCLDQNVSMLELGRSWSCHSDERGRVRGTRLVLSSSLGCRGDVFGGRSQRNQRSQRSERSEGRWRERAAPKQGRQDHSVSRVLHIERIFRNSVGWFKILPEFKDPWIIWICYQSSPDMFGLWLFPTPWGDCNRRAVRPSPARQARSSFDGVKTEFAVNLVQMPFPTCNRM